MLIVACGTGNSSPEDTLRSEPFFDGDIVELQIGNVGIIAAVADTLSERSEGLSRVDDLGDLDGMLFVFDAPRTLRFNMDDVLIPLDVWFIDESGVIFGSAEMEPCLADSCPRYPSPGEAAWGLETPAGAFKFAVGDRVLGLESSG